MQPHTVVWYENWRGPMVFKEVAGDFVFTTEVHIGDRDDVGSSDLDGIPDDAAYSLGGLMIRTPRDITDPAVEDDGHWRAQAAAYLDLAEVLRARAATSRSRAGRSSCSGTRID